MKISKPGEDKDRLGRVVNNILVDVADIGLVQGVGIFIGADICKEYIFQLLRLFKMNRR